MHYCHELLYDLKVDLSKIKKHLKTIEEQVIQTGANINTQAVKDLQALADTAAFSTQYRDDAMSLLVRLGEPESTDDSEVEEEIDW